MPNRIIKESICRSDSIDSLSWFEEVLFYRLIVVCDDYGRFDGRPAIIRGSCFPLKDIRLEHIESALSKLSTAGMVGRYEVGGRPYLQLIAWEHHQQIRAHKSKFPAPDESCKLLISNDINGYQQKSDDIKCPRNPIQSESNPKRNADARAIDRVEHFDDFWDAYPNKQRRHLAEKAYCDLLLTGTVSEDSLVRAAKNYSAYIKESGDKVFLPNNFLEKCVFEDYLQGRCEDTPSERELEVEEVLVGEDEKWWEYGPNGWEE